MRLTGEVALVGLVALMVCGLCGEAGATSLSRMTSYGPVTGAVSKAYPSVIAWQGIPFAAPPTGDLRFKPPQAPKSWTEPLMTTDSGPGCPMYVEPVLKGTEDCLYLDVYAPINVTADTQVMVFIHGGGYVIGNDYHKGLYDGAHLAAKHGVIVVAMNYRLSVLGFLALDALKVEAGGTTGNYGLQDQQLALKWVASNIAAFGGDPDSVLLFGESAGAFSLCWHLVSPGSKGLFAAVLFESGNCDSPSFFRPYEYATNFSAGYAAHVGCDPDALSEAELLGCLRALPLPKLIDGGVLLAGGSGGSVGRFPPDVFWPKLAPIMPWGIAIDGSPAGLTGVPSKLIAAGKGMSNVPLLMGTNRNEGSIFLPMMIAMVPGIDVLPLSERTALLVLSHFFNSSVVAQARELYPRYAYKSWDKMASALLTDYFFVCSARRMLRAFGAAYPGTPRYTYRYVYKTDSPLYPVFGDYHSSELKFVFGNPVHNIPFDKTDWTMSDIFGWYWTNYARAHAPSGASPSSVDPYPFWPQWNETAQITQLLDVPVGQEAFLDDVVCDFWDRVKVDYSS
ncbi:carboxylesterase [Thecamonas trahens ATCC 50062]|uniref:Carboxylic ester hydrolase n=1 Tax=Thecamonas trahens ATCC 50062 TaxID=461836 RepID=A0A0L0DN25_THETB|nr:carboxylesterase [Thecamonas trahens ATCC 50062]KNC53709.1 carboxylesterase [Thecamonas trahens ATCC 50062]|eukprot:XP_013762023.1 carboxylesterase [Thecamonas trahens ATCC 50062]